MRNNYLGVLQSVTWVDDTITLSGSHESVTMHFSSPRYKRIPMETINSYVGAYTENIGKKVVIFENGHLQIVSEVYETIPEEI